MTAPKWYNISNRMTDTGGDHLNRTTKKVSDWQELLRTVSLRAEDNGFLNTYILGELGSRVHCHTLWSGIDIIANDVWDKDLRPPVIHMGHFISLNYCISGRCEGKIVGSDRYVYVGGGMVCIDNHGQKEGYHYPSGRFEGVEFVFDTNVLRREMPEALTDIGFSLGRIEEILAENNGTFLAATTDEMNALVATVYGKLRDADTAPAELKYYAIRLIYELMIMGHIKANPLTFVTRGQREIATEVEKLITEDLSKRYSVSELAERYGISDSTLKKYFRLVFGENISDYLMARRMNEVKKLLVGTTMDIGEIAESVGYINQGKFGKAFRNCTGVTPLEYRRQRYRTAGSAT